MQSFKFCISYTKHILYLAQTYSEFAKIISVDFYTQLSPDFRQDNYIIEISSKIIFKTDWNKSKRTALTWRHKNEIASHPLYDVHVDTSYMYTESDNESEIRSLMYAHTFCLICLAHMCHTVHLDVEGTPSLIFSLPAS